MMVGLNYYTEDEHQRIEAFKGAPPAIKKYMIQTLEASMDDVDDEGIREFCKRILRRMGRNERGNWNEKD